MKKVVRKSVTLPEALRRYDNAKRRAFYWSGVPSLSLRHHTRETSSALLWEKYAIAMADCRNWENFIEKETGKRLKHYEPKGTFQHRAAKALFR